MPGIATLVPWIVPHPTRPWTNDEPADSEYRRLWPKGLPGGISAWSWRVGNEPTNEFFGLGRTLLTTWTMMQQTLTVSRRQLPDRAEQRRAHRAGRPPDPITIVLLRRQEWVGDAPEPEEGSVAWTHRWLVDGHWRNQWLPSRAAHRLQWIAGHVKGPGHLPLVVKQRVRAWVR